MLLVFSYSSALVVFAALLWIVLRRPWMLVRPSVMFLGFYWLQVQFAAAFNAHLVYPGLDHPWRLAAVLHGFPLAVLMVILPTFRGISARVAGRIEIIDVDPEQQIARLCVLFAAIYAIAGFYLLKVPFTQTGLYALLFDPAHLDQYRELSMKLLDQPVVAYSFTIMEKVLAPLAGGFAAAAAISAFRRRRLLPAALSLLLLVAAALPTLLYGARGPLSMVVLAAIVAVIVLNLRRLRLAYLGAAIVICLVPIAAISVLKSERVTPEAAWFQMANIVDRAVGRGYIDNVWHLSYVERHGFHGIAGIPKLAVLVGEEPVDILNLVGREYGGKTPSTGLAFLGVSQPPRPCDIRLNCDEQLSEKQPDGLDVNLTSSSGASFQTLNFAMFGWWSLPASVAFVLALDLLLYAYMRMPGVSLVPVIAAISVPVLGLCFSMMTTILASKGLLLIPMVGWAVGLNWPRMLRRAPA